MAKKMVKCLYCGETFDASSEEFVKPRSNRYAHKKCAEEHDNSAEVKLQKDKEELEEYIKHLYNTDKVPLLASRQIEQFRKEYGYTYSGMLKTLIYHYEIKGGDIEKARGGIGIVSYVYQDAEKYYYNIWAAQQQNVGKKIEDFVEATEEVHIVPPKREPMAGRRKIFTFLEEPHEQ